MNQREKVLEHLIKYGSITRNEAIGTYRITRLAEYARQLKDMGIQLIRSYEGKNKDDYRYTVPEDKLEAMRAARKAKEFANRYGITVYPSQSRALPTDMPFVLDMVVSTTSILTLLGILVYINNKQPPPAI